MFECGVRINARIQTSTPKHRYTTHPQHHVKNNKITVCFGLGLETPCQQQEAKLQPSATINGIILTRTRQNVDLIPHAIQIFKSQYIKLDSYVWNTEMCTWKRACQVAPLQKEFFEHKLHESERQDVVIFVLLEHLFTSLPQLRYSQYNRASSRAAAASAKGQSHVVVMNNSNHFFHD